MYFDIFVIFMIVLLLFLIALELNNYVFDKRHTYPMELSSNTTDTFKDYESKFAEFKKPPKVLKPSYENQYSIIDNRISVNKINNIENKAFIFYENDICRDLKTDNNNLHTITRELSCGEMNDYLNNTVIGKYHDDIPKEVLNDLAIIPVENWGDEKIILNNMNYKIKENQLNLDENKNENNNDNNDNIDNYVNLSQKIKYINIVINKFIKVINDNFESSKYFTKYNKYHPFDFYKLSSYKISKFYTYNEGDLKYQRGIIKINIHRTYKVNDFIILLDIFFIPRPDFKNIFKEESDFKDAYYFFIKTARVIGNPIKHNSKFLEEDDTDFVLSDFKILTEDMFADLQVIKKLSVVKNLSTIEENYKKLFEKIVIINQNKTFNSIVFKELLFEMKKIAKPRENVADELKSEIEILYEKLIEKFIIYCQRLLNTRKTLKKDLDQDIPFSESQLIGQTIFTDEINQLINEYEDNPEKVENVYDLTGIEYRCYDPRYTDKVLDAYTTRPSCISYHDEIGVNGVYDKKCKVDDDCPFYKSNTNYPNDFGGCNKETGICQVPSGLKIIGGTKVSNIGKPLCYNCDKVRDNKNKTFIDDAKCCHLQYNNPDFESPDFIFEGDKKLRFKHKEILADKGLKP